MYCIVGCGAKA